jgi:hypothetical protein
VDRIRKLVFSLILLLLWGGPAGPFLCAGDGCVIVNGAGDFPLSRLAAREVRRYVYVRTGELLPIVAARSGGGDRVVLEEDPSLDREEYGLNTRPDGKSRVLTISGGSDIAVLYGVYHFAEILGVRFALHGDVIPDGRIALTLPEIDVTRTPLFEQRGIQPFHDFTEGPDWWSMDDYKAVLTQMVKLRMNWIGFHCYPEGNVGPEPLVWIGLPEDVNADGTVRSGYPSRWASTAGGSWGYEATKTSDFAAGAGLLFACDDFGSPVTDGFRPLPRGSKECNALFNRAGVFLDEVFSRARALGIRTCIGTETPLHIPADVRRRLEEKGYDPDDPETVRRLYEGIFTRIARCHPLDYYWLWTPEGWTWRDVSRKQVEGTLADIDLALEALDRTERPFGFAACGWVLGPPGDRALFARELPPHVAVSCINRQVGFTPVEPGFAKVHERAKWAIPWVEDDPAMIVPQLWAGRLRRDAADAHACGCTGLMGIHWRTKVLEPNFAVLAAAAWDQSDWNGEFGKKTAPPEPGEAESDPPAFESTSLSDRARDLPCDDFYRDWCRASFGREASDELSLLFTHLDGGEGRYGSKKATRLPRPADWIGGPGGIRVNDRPWEEEKKRYAFVDEMAALRAKVAGPGSLARFEYWLDTFCTLRAIGRLGCARGTFDRIVKRIDEATDDAEKKEIAEGEALPARLELARLWERMITFQLAAADTIGAFGTIANMEMHVRRGVKDARFLDLHDGKLAAVLGRPLPDGIHPRSDYMGEPRLIVPTVRSVVDEGEALTVKVVVLDNSAPRKAALYRRSFGDGRFEETALTHAGRGVFTATLPPATGIGFEYYVAAVTSGGGQLLWPASAPAQNQTIVVAPSLKGGKKRKPVLFPESWEGIWKGTCRAQDPKGGGFSFAMELHILPLSDEERMTWKIVYGEGAKRQVRDYEIVALDRSRGLFSVDEKNSILIDSFLIGDALHSQYSVGGTLITIRYAMQQGTIVFDLLSSSLENPTESGGDGDVPAVFAYPVSAAQRAVLVRQ